MLGTDTPTLPVGSAFQGGYEILSELGAGSFGRVYKARQRSTGQAVAIKVLRIRDGDRGPNSQNQVDRFRRETRLCAALSHPNIVRLLDSGESADAVLYAVFEYVPGATLKDTLLTDGALSVQETVHLMSQVLDALSCAHALGVVHRDLKPENIMITKTGARRNALVLDFGLGGFARDAMAETLSRITATHELLGTPCYAAPEQLRGEPPTARSDLYSWGLILLECLTGDISVHGASAQEVILKQLGPEPVPIPTWLRNHPLGRVIELATAKRVERRDISIDHVLQLLTTLVSGEVPSPSGARVDEKLGRERRQLTIMCCRLTISATDGREPDVEEIDQLLQARRQALAERAARVGGTVATILADRVFLVFGYPQAREDDARRAARLAVAIAGEAAAVVDNPTAADLQVGVRIGLHTGLVIVSDLRQGAAPRLYELTGITPQVASYLVDRAEPGEVLASLDTHGLLRHEFASEAAGTCEMAELSRPLPVFRLTGVRRSDAATETAVRANETQLVGRANELKQLHDGWANARAGRSGAVVITGEAGIGKSRLVHELRQHVGINSWLECGCAPENQTAALAPVIDLLLAMDRSIEALLTRVGLDVAENLPLLAALLSQPADARFASLHLSPERQKELTLHALVNLLFRRAEHGPMVLAIENLHWADPTTIELISLFLQEVRAARYADPESAPKLYLVFTTRPEFVVPWSTEDVAFLPLQRLARAEVEEMVRVGLARDGELPPALAKQVVERADGVPLFVEEITRLLLEARPQGSVTASLQGLPEIPTSLRDLLTARLDSVSSAALETAQLAAVLGREFRLEVLQAVSSKDAAFLREDIAELGRAALVFQRRSAGHGLYIFRHALLRDAAYEALTRPVRQSLHRRVAEVLARQFPDIRQNRPEILAQHCEGAEQLLAAAEYWHQAGERALRRAAYVEAVQQLERGLAVLRTMPTSSDRRREEVALLTTLGTVHFFTKGYAAPEVGQAFAEAWQLCEQLGDDVPLKVLYGIWAFQFARGDRMAARGLAPRFQPLAADPRDLITAIAAHSALGANAFWLGRFREAEDHLVRGRQLYGADAGVRFAEEFGYDPGLYCYAYGCSSLWQLGYPDQSQQVRSEMLALAERSRNPYLIALALGFSLTELHDRGDTDLVLQLADRLTELATEQHLYLWLATATVAYGGALVQREQAATALPVVQQGLDLYRGMGVLSSYMYYLTYLAAAHLGSGDIAAGLATVDESFTLSETQLGQFHLPELHRLKGELLMAQGEHDAAEAHLRRAMEIAQAQEGKSYELRAATSLSRLLRTLDKGGEARGLLTGVYEWFTEGFETADLRKARALLTELA